MNQKLTQITWLLAGLFFLSLKLSAQADVCSSATLISSDQGVAGAGTNVGTLSGATASGVIIASSCTAIDAQDVWYKFVAKTTNPTISVSGLGTSWGTTMKIQLLSGTCGAFTEVACGNNISVTPAFANSLILGTTYHIRIYKNTTTVPTGTTWGFTLALVDDILKGSRLNEMFSRTVLSGTGALDFPWEVIYGPDNNLWITESRGYRVVRINPTTRVKTTVLDLNSGSTWLPSPADSLNAVNNNVTPWTGSRPQGGFAGLALHPNFLDATGGNDYAYVAYVHRMLGGTSPSGIFFRNKLVRFTFNRGNNRFESPIVLCDTLPGSSDHNSQRMIIAPVVKNGPKFLFYASGDMGSGQFGNRTRPMKAQNKDSYEGKILRFNLTSDGDAGAAAWIPNSNSYSANSAVYNIGMRNNQGFAYDTATNILYGSSHGPYSDDEINVIEPFKNYGHPLVVGFADGNYNGNTAVANERVSAGAPFTDASGVSACDQILSEANQVGVINGTAAAKGAYKSPLFSAYPTAASTVMSTWQNPGSNANWFSEGWSGMDLYTDVAIPGWKRSLVNAGLKWGRLVRIQLGTSGMTTMPSNKDTLNFSDTVTYFQSVNRYRDLAFGPNGKDIFLVMDNSSATSGPGVGNPTTPGCAGCVIKYSFLGYSDVAGVSNISKTIPVSAGTSNTCNVANSVTIDESNNFLWVPITGSDGNIVAEINAMGQNLGLVITSFYQHSGAARSAGGLSYLNRNITITPTIKTFTTPVKVRLYMSRVEVDALIASPTSGVTTVNDIKILKNQDACRSTMGSTTTAFTTTNTLLADKQQGANGYVLQAAIPSFSSFYFGSNSVVLPVDQLFFTGVLNNNLSVSLKWTTENEVNTSYFSLERSVDGVFFDAIKRLDAAGNTTNQNNYGHNDIEIVSVAPTTAYYRLKIVDTDGRFKYSDVVKFNFPSKFGSMTIFPNPVYRELKAQVVSNTVKPTIWRIIDNTGRTVRSGNSILSKGVNALSINLGPLAVGTYYLKITGTDMDLNSRFVIAGN